MQQPTQTRSRTVSWEDPAATFEHAAALSGLEYLEAIKNRELPPPRSRSHSAWT